MCASLPLLLLLALLANSARTGATRSTSTKRIIIKNTGSAFDFNVINTPDHFKIVHDYTRDMIYTRTFDCFRLSKWSFGKVDCFKRVFQKPIPTLEFSNSGTTQRGRNPWAIPFSVSYMYAAEMAPESGSATDYKSRIFVANSVVYFLRIMQRDFAYRCGLVEHVDLAPCDAMASDERRIFKMADVLHDAA